MLEKLEKKLVKRYRMAEIDSVEVFREAKSRVFCSDDQCVQEAKQMYELYKLHRQRAMDSGAPLGNKTFFLLEDFRQFLLKM